MTPAEYQRQVQLIGSRTATLLLREWSRVDRASISSSWKARLASAVQIVTAGQLAAALLADDYLDGLVGEAGPRVVPQALAGRTLDGLTLDGLLVLPQIDALRQIGRGASPAVALRSAGGRLVTYGRTATTDSARQAVAAGMGARPRVGGYWRRLSLPSCGRCVIIAGRWFRWNRGFSRHPRCDCVHVPGADPGDGPGYDARQAILDGQVTGLSRAETEAIRLGADPAQVVNARRGMSTVGGRQVTTEGTTRRGVAGARILAAEADRLAGADTNTAVYRNLTISREQAADLADAMRRGDPFTRRTAGGVQTAAYRRTRAARPTPEQILADATSRDNAVRQLINNGYII